MAQQGLTALKGGGGEPVAPGQPPRTVEIFIAGTPPGPNQKRKYSHWSEAAAQTRQWKDTAYVLVHEATGGRIEVMAQARIQFIYVAPHPEWRDPDNLVAACKPVIDGIVASGLIPDDNFGVLVGIEIGCEVGEVKGLRVRVLEVVP